MDKRAKSVKMERRRENGVIQRHGACEKEELERDIDRKIQIEWRDVLERERMNESGKMRKDMGEEEDG